MESSKLAKSTFRFQFCKGFFFFIWGLIHPLIPRCCQKFPLAKMSFSSKLKNVIPKGTMHKLKFVQTINCCGSDTLKTEKVKTLRHGQQATLMTSKQDHSSSPFKLQNCRILMYTPLNLIWKGLMSPRKDRLWYFFFNHYKNCRLTV